MEFLVMACNGRSWGFEFFFKSETLDKKLQSYKTVDELADIIIWVFDFGELSRLSWKCVVILNFFTRLVVLMRILLKNEVKWLII